MKRIAAMLLLMGLMGCSVPQGANINQSHRGFVMVTDWSPRTFTIQEDGSNAMITYKSCSGQMPVWIWEHVQINSHFYWDGFTSSYTTYCQVFDWVERIGPDLNLSVCERPKMK